MANDGQVLITDRHDMDRGQERVDNPAKVFLRRYIWLRKRRDTILEEIRDHYSSATSCAVRLKPIPISGGGGAYDRMAEDVCRIVDTKDRLERWAYRLDCQAREIEDVIEQLSDERCRTVLVYRYLNGYTWDKIAERMSYDRSQVIVWHGRALAEVNKIISPAEKPDEIRR